LSFLTIYETVGDAWKTNIGPSINSVPSDAFVALLDSSGDLEVINEASKEMAGGLISENIAVPAGAKYFGLDVIFALSDEDRPHFARGENDLKVTFADGSQANFSTQWNDDKQMWQLDPTGKTWVDSGYTKPVVIGRNKWQVRGSFDGKTWSVTGLSFNDDTPFTPDPAKFANLPAIASGWGPGLHPQLQTEARKAPFFLRESYHSVRILASDIPIPFTLSN
jgi:hypothetical protein